MMTCARFNNVKRFCVGALAIVMLALMSSGHPSGQVVAASTAVNFDGTNDYITFGSGNGCQRPRRDGLYARVVVQVDRRRSDR